MEQHPVGYRLRPLRAHEWREARDLRLRALQDEDAALAFYRTYEEALQTSDEQWRANAEAAAGDEDRASSVRQFVAVDAADRWVGTVTVIVQRAGEPEFGGGRIEQDRGQLVAVWVDPEHRGRGLLGALVDLALTWAAEVPLSRAALWVHEDNARARRAYERAGFVPTGKRVVERMGPELLMVKDVPRRGQR